MKRFFCIILMMCMSLMMASCSSDVEDPAFYYDSTTVSVYTTIPTATTQASTNPQPTESAPTVPFFSNLSELRDYLNMKKDANILEFSFRYIGSEELSAQLLARMTNAYYISYNCTSNIYDIVITEYPGDRIVDAWNNNDTSALNSSELQILNTAVNMVNQAKSKASNTYELEVIIHDMLADHITYYDSSRDVSSANDLQRHLTVVGALLDGKANCQGYTDAFYTLGSIAGLKVGRLSVETPDDLHVTNTICFNNTWYILDVTYDDQDSDGVTNYRLFNAGKDVIREYSWPDYLQVNPIASVSDDFFYYKHYDIVYTDMQTMSQEMADEWATNGTKTVRGMLMNKNDMSSFDDVFRNAVQNTRKPFNYTFWYYYNDCDTYYTVIFDY